MWMQTSYEWHWPTPALVYSIVLVNDYTHITCIAMNWSCLLCCIGEVFCAVMVLDVVVDHTATGGII